MGRERECRVRLGRRSAEGRALLESQELRFRGELPLRIPFAEIRAVTVRDGVLSVTFGGGTARFELGDAAEAWANRIRNPKSLLDKLGVRPGMRVAVLGVEDSGFEKDLAACGVQVSRGRPLGRSDLVFLGADAPSALARLPALRESILPDGGVWVVWPKGRPGLREDDIRTAGRRAGLVDVKVVALSASHSALKLVIPRRDRG